MKTDLEKTLNGFTLPVDIPPRPELLLCAQIPKPMHGVAPRTIKGGLWWDMTRREIYLKYNYKCAACGIARDAAAFHTWLEAHEVYEIDFKKGRMTFIEVVPLCHSCHNYIHKGRLEILAITQEISETLYDTIINHGDSILRQANLIYPPKVESSTVPWDKWRLIFEGVEYPPKYKSYEEWYEHYMK